MTETTEKQFSGYIVVNWKEEDVRHRKSKPSNGDLSPFEVAVKHDLTVEVPEMEIPTLSTTLQVPEVQVKEAVSELTDVDYEEESEFPEPRKVMFQEAENLEEDLNEFENQEDFEATEAYVKWLRDLLSYEYENRGRQSVVNLLENRIVEVKGDE